MVFRSSMFAAACSAAVVLFGSVSAGNPNALTPATGAKDELCSLIPDSYSGAKRDHPEIAFAINELEKHSIATWFSDREVNGDYNEIAQRLVNACSESKRLSVVVYGIPNKDCEAGYSASGSRVKNADDYVKFLNVLTDTVKDRKVLYVLEPDAVGLLAKDGGCGEAAGYRANLQTAIQKLSVNPNAEIYLDVGYWSLAYPEPTQRVVEVVKDLVKNGGRVKGITLNTSNYRKTSEIADLCTNFQTAMGSGYEMNCIVDTSRNFNGSPSTEWCNVGAAGIGQPPSSSTGVSNLDYFLWIKPPGESDGQCDGSGHTADSLRGPEPGKFFLDGFKKLWDQGFFVYSKNMAKTDGSNSFQQSTDPVTPQTDAPVTTTPATTTPAPVPDVTTSTPAPEPTTVTPISEETTSTPAPEVTTGTSAPEATTVLPPVPESTTPAPSATTVSPASTSPVGSDVTTTAPPVPTTTSTPSSGSTDTPLVTPTVTPIITPCPSITSRPSPSDSSSGTSTTTPTESPATTETPTTTPIAETPTTTPVAETPTTTAVTEMPVPTDETPSLTDETPAPTTASPLSSSDVAQNEADMVDAGPKTIASAPAGVEANTKSGTSSSSFTGGIIAAVLIGVVVLAVAAAMVAYVRRRAKAATADDMKTPTTLDTAQNAYLSQL